MGRKNTTQRDTRTLQKGRAHTLLAIFGKCASGRGPRVLRVQLRFWRSNTTENHDFYTTESLGFLITKIVVFVTLGRVFTTQRDE